jgi:hypothetical protein
VDEAEHRDPEQRACACAPPAAAAHRRVPERPDRLPEALGHDRLTLEAQARGGQAGHWGPGARVEQAVGGDEQGKRERDWFRKSTTTKPMDTLLLLLVLLSRHPPVALTAPSVVEDALAAAMAMASCTAANAFVLRLPLFCGGSWCQSGGRGGAAQCA